MKQFKVYDFDSKNAIVEYINNLDLNKSYSVKITNKRETRTLSQNRLYWLYISCISEHTGYEKNELHDYLRGLFLEKEATKIFNEIQVKLTSTTSLDTKLMKNYIDKIIVWASTELQITLPDQNDRYFESFYEQYKNYI